MNLSVCVTLEELVKGWTHKTINVSSLYKNEDKGFCIQVVCDGETADYVRLFIKNKTIATKRSTIVDYSDWKNIIEAYIPSPEISDSSVETDNDFPF